MPSSIFLCLIVVVMCHISMLHSFTYILCNCFNDLLIVICLDMCNCYRLSIINFYYIIDGICPVVLTISISTGLPAM
jgi:hypothetical protein